MRSALVIAGVLAALLVAGFYRIQTTTADPQGYKAKWIATRALRKNHQIVPGDLAYPAEGLAAGRLLLQDNSAEGMHLQAPVLQGESLTPDAIAIKPNLAPGLSSQTYFYVLTEDATPVGGWTEGAAVIPCYKLPDKPKDRPVCIHTPLPILAVHKSTATGDASWLALEIPEKLRCTFAEFALADKRLLMQVKIK